MKEHLEKASETLQRSDATIIKRDKSIYGAILNASETVETGAHKFAFVTNNVSTYCKENNLIDLIASVSEYYTRDLKYLSTIVYNMYEKFDINKYNFMRNNITLIFNETKQFHLDFKNCIGNMNLRCNDVVLFQFSKYAPSYLVDFIDEYRQRTSYLLIEDLKKDKQHYNCLMALSWLETIGLPAYEEFDRSISLIQAKLNSLATLKSEVPQIDFEELILSESIIILNITEFIESSQINELLQMLTNNRSSNDSTLESCRWMDNSLQMIMEETQSYEETKLDSLLANTNSVQYYFHRIATSSDQLNSTYHRIIKPSISMIEQYLGGNITKNELSNEMTSSRSKTRQDSMGDDIDKVAVTTEEWLNYYAFDRYFIKDMFSTFLSSQLPILTYNNLNETDFGKDLLKNAGNNFGDKLPNINQLAESTRSEFKNVILNQIDYYFSKLSDVVGITGSEIQKVKMFDLMNEEREELTEYRNSLKMDKSFYM